jgi:hypothetical protein
LARVSTVSVTNATSGMCLTMASPDVTTVGVAVDAGGS